MDGLITGAGAILRWLSLSPAVGLAA